MTNIWNKLSAREQALIASALILLFILALALIVIRPVMLYQADAEQNLAAAKSEYRTIAGLANARENLSREATLNGKPNDQSPRVLISTSARDAGIVVSRIQPAESGSLTLWMDSVSSTVFYAWLKTLESEYSIVPELVSLQKNGDLTLRAQVQFAGVQ